MTPEITNSVTFNHNLLFIYNMMDICSELVVNQFFCFNYVKHMKNHNINSVGQPIVFFINNMSYEYVINLVILGQI